MDKHDQPLNEAASQNVSYRERESPRPSQRLKAILMDDNGCLDSYGLIRSDAIRKTSLYLPYYGPEKVFIAELALMGKYAEIPECLFFARVLSEGSGAVATAVDQQAFASGADGAKPHFVRLKFLKAYAKAIAHSRLGTLETLRCYAVVLRWMFQFSKWPRLVAKALRRQGIGGRNIERIKDNKQETTTVMDGNP